MFPGGYVAFLLISTCFMRMNLCCVVQDPNVQPPPKKKKTPSVGAAFVKSHKAGGTDLNHRRLIIIGQAKKPFTNLESRYIPSKFQF